MFSKNPKEERLVAFKIENRPSFSQPTSLFHTTKIYRLIYYIGRNMYITNSLYNFRFHQIESNLQILGDELMKSQNQLTKPQKINEFQNDK